MSKEGITRVSSEESTITITDASADRKRKKRKWDQPAEILVSAGIAVPGSHTLAGVASVVAGGGVSIPQIFQVPSIPQHATAVINKLNQTKVQEELIAREIVINDAESSIRYKLTKRQTQEEIQNCTGTVVITRGKYRTPNAPPDGEKPLYLHISAGAHLKEMAERIIAVDRAAAMVDEMLKQVYNSQPAFGTFGVTPNNLVKALSSCVYLGFDADPSLNIAARIRGPNDQYINHIMNETGAAVLLRGRGAGNLADLHSEESQQPLHLYLSSNNPKSIEDARRLAENLLDTICVEFGASRVSSLKAYNAVPPPQQLLAGVQSSGNDIKVNTTTSNAPSSPSPGGSFIPGQSLPIMTNYPQTSLSGGTSYNGYGGIYPQATPLQQVALALRQTSPSGFALNGTPGTSLVGTIPKSNDISASENGKRPLRRRKFQERPDAAMGPPKQHQAFEIHKSSSGPSDEPIIENVSTMPGPKKLVQFSSSLMPPPPPRTIMPPPPPPKYTSSTLPPPKLPEKTDANSSAKSDPAPVPVPDTLIKLMEYGDDDEDEETSE